MQVWQIAAGEKGRFYDDLFLKHDVMFMGPGRFGHAINDAASYDSAVSDGLETRAKVNMIRRAFAEEVEKGDIVLLRKGYKVRAIGVVASDSYSWEECFDDVYGWDLQHVRRVAWQTQLTASVEAAQRGSPMFKGRKQTPTLTRVNANQISAAIQRLIGQCVPRDSLAALPEVSPVLSMDDFASALFAKGLPNRAVDEVVQAVSRQRRLQAWYQALPRGTKRPTEHEVVAHMVLPLLLALGWSEQLLAVEWRKIDLAGFLGTPTEEANCVLVCEAKRGGGLQEDYEQAQKYVEDHQLARCSHILLTEGNRFYLYKRRPRDPWPESPTGYVNFSKLRTNHLAPAGTNAIDTIIELTPQSMGR